MIFRPLVVVSLVLVAMVAEAQVYKWTDEHGKVHFSDQPPREKNAATEKVELRTAPKTGNSPAASEVDRDSRQRELLKTLEQERKQREDKRAKAKDEKKRKAALCKYLLKERDETIRANAIYKKGADGERIFYSEAEMDKMRKEIVERYQRECGK